MSKSKSSRLLIENLLNTAIALVWLINGLFCKVLHLVPRHQEIVARILGPEHAFLLTKVIGVSEILLFVWIISRIRPRWCALVQIVIIAVMNAIEFFLAPDLLLFGRMNSLFALLLILVIYFNAFVIGKAGQGRDLHPESR